MAFKTNVSDDMVPKKDDVAFENDVADNMAPNGHSVWPRLASLSTLSASLQPLVWRLVGHPAGHPVRALSGLHLAFRLALSCTLSGYPPFGTLVGIPSSPRSAPIRLFHPAPRQAPSIRVVDLVAPFRPQPFDGCSLDHLTGMLPCLYKAILSPHCITPTLPFEIGPATAATTVLLEFCWWGLEVIIGGQTLSAFSTISTGKR